MMSSSCCKVISDVASRTPVDLRRVYATGMSNGGMMAYALAAKASGHVAAIASVSGQVELPGHPSVCAVPTMEFHSVDDPIALCKGSPNSNPRKALGHGGDRPVGGADGCDPPVTASPIVGARIHLGK